MATHPLRFIRRGEQVRLENVPPDRTLLELLREDLGCKGTKEGCAEGDCGACTVVVADAHAPHPGRPAALRWRSINACIRLAHSIDGMALFTVEDLASAGALHPAQEAMVRCHASQCGFCTPGFVMSLFGLYCKERQQSHAAPVTREVAQEALSGNLCRCTGYRPILDAAQAMHTLPPHDIDEAALLAQLDAFAHEHHPPSSADYLAPTSLSALLKARARLPQAQLVAGCTDAGLWVTKQLKRFQQIIDLTRATELRRIERYEHHIAIGAAVTLQEAFAALCEERPQLGAFARRFAGLPIRNSGTLGGNIANGSPIGDSMPLLIALGAHVMLMSVRGHREMPLEDFYTGYRKNVLAPDEIVAWIKVPRPKAGEFLRAYKISKRFEDDISAVCLVIAMRLEGGRVSHMRIGAGGVAATPARARKAEAAAIGREWSEPVAHGVAVALRGEFQPIADMRASAEYRTRMLGKLVRRFWLESQGLQDINLESVHEVAP